LNNGALPFGIILGRRLPQRKFSGPTTACSGRRSAPPLMLSVDMTFIVKRARAIYFMVVFLQQGSGSVRANKVDGGSC
jgi:hypothetical protein